MDLYGPGSHNRWPLFDSDRSYARRYASASQSVRSAHEFRVALRQTLHTQMSLPTPSSSHGESSRSKIQIPRLPQKRKEPPVQKPPVNRLDRVSRACLTCRSRKVKCDGGVPSCSNCRDNATACVYVGSRKDRLRTFVDRAPLCLAIAVDNM